MLIITAPAYSARYVLSSNPQGTAPIYVNDDITIKLTTQNGEITIVDDESQSPSTLGPFSFYADEGDKLSIEARDTTKPAVIEKSKLPDPQGNKELSPIYLVNTATGRATLIFAGLPKQHSSLRGSDTFLTLDYTIGTPTKLYCLSSAPDRCSQVEVSDDLPMIKVSQEEFSLEIHPDNDGRPRTHFLLKMALPAGGDIDLELDLTNIYKDALSTPLYLVPVDGMGKPIVILDHPIFISGDCGDYNSCPEVTFFSYKGTVSMGTAYQEEADFYADFYPPEDPELYGFNLSVKLIHPNVPMYIFFTEPDGENVFYTPYGIRKHGLPLTVANSFEAELITGKNDVWTQAFEAGYYSVTLSDPEGKHPYSYNFTVDTSLKDVEAGCSGMEEEGTISPVPSGPTDTDESFIERALESASLRGSTVTFQEGNQTVSCVIGMPSGKGVSRGMSYRAISTGDFKVFFILGMSCTDANGTAVPSAPYLSSFNIQIKVDSQEGSTILYPSMEPLTTNRGVAFVYAELPLMGVEGTPTLRYSYQASDPSGFTYALGPFSSKITPPHYSIESPEGYTNGAKVEFHLSPGGTPFYTLEFSLLSRRLNSGSQAPSQLKPQVHVDLNGDGRDDVVIDMFQAIPGSGIFRSVRPLIITNPQSPVTYHFSTNPSVSAVGYIIQNTFTLSLPPVNYPVLVRIGGDRQLKLGESATFTFYARSAPYQQDPQVDVYIGLYKKGRGIVWISSAIPGAWVPATTCQKRPLVSQIRLSDLNNGGYLPVTLQIPRDTDPEGFLWIGEYSWILEIDNHDTQETLAKTIFPFTIEAP